MHNSYESLGFSESRRVCANLDKCSANCQSKVVLSKVGRFELTRVENGHRRYSCSKSDTIHNGGNYSFRTLANRIADAYEAIG